MSSICVNQLDFELQASNNTPVSVHVQTLFLDQTHHVISAFDLAVAMAFSTL